jgi:hypothetical protein
MFEELFRTFRRFPAPLITALGACVAGWYLVWNPDAAEFCAKLLFSLTLGVILFASLTLMNERPALPKGVKPFYVFLAGLLFLAFFFFYLASNETVDCGTRCAHWLFIALLFLTIAPYLAAEEINGFWQFSKRFVLRVIISCFYSGVLFAGISLALTAVHKLLGIEIDNKVYQYLWTFAAFVFGPLHLLSGTPGDYAELEADKSYPKGLKLFTQYVLIPLASVYFLILYAYMAKILYTQQWPQGWVSWLTSSASVLGLVTFLLLYPVRELEENRWVKGYSRGFCAAAIPLLLMLLAAVYKRYAQYGLTEHRYFLIVLAVWLLGIFLYFILNRKPNIKLVPVSLVLVAVLVSFGPWGAYSVSLSSQLGRLEKILLTNKLLVNGKAVKLEQELGWEERKQLSGCLDYIVTYHGVKPLKKYFTQNLELLGPDGSGELMKFMGQTHLSQWAQNESKQVSFSADKTEMLVRGYDRVVDFHTRYGLAKGSESGTKYLVALDRNKQTLKIFEGKLFKIEVPLKPMAGKILAGREHERAGSLPQSLMAAEAENGTMKVKVYFYNLSGNRGEDGVVGFINGYGLLLLKEKPGGKGHGDPGVI